MLLADDVGLAVALMKGSRLGFLEMLYVRPRRARRGTVARADARGGRALACTRRRGARARGARVERARARGVRAVGLPAVRADARRADRARSSNGSPTSRRGRRSVSCTCRATTSEKVRRDAVKVLRAEPDVELESGWVRVRSDATDADPARAQVAREGNVVHERRRCARTRRRAGHGRPVQPLRPRRRRRRVSLRPRVLRPAAAGRRLRDGREPDRRRAADRRRPEARARGRRTAATPSASCRRRRSCTSRSRPSSE